MSKKLTAEDHAAIVEGGIKQAQEQGSPGAIGTTSTAMGDGAAIPEPESLKTARGVARGGK